MAQSKKEIHRELLAQLATATGGLAPDDYVSAWWNWYLNLSREPDKQLNLLKSAVEKSLDTWQFAWQAAAGVPFAAAGIPASALGGTAGSASAATAGTSPAGSIARGSVTGGTPGAGTPSFKTASSSASAAPGPSGFADPAWNVWPFNLYARSYANWASWMQEALQAGTNTAAAASPEHNRLRFAAQQMLAAANPANFLHTNPELLNQTVRESGQNLVRGLKHWLEDAEAITNGRQKKRAAQFEVGKDVAVTPGKVVYSNRLIELLQYSPQTETVYAEPILITPAWIMKYYILDLSPRNSMVRYLVEQGHTVFMISWKNPTAADRDLGLDDYVQLGLREALNAVGAIVPDRKIHAVGYCIGGTLLSIGTALLAQQGDTRIASVTLLAALTEFSEPGELSVFISPSQLAMLEAVMHKAGVLESERMGGAFTLLRSRDLLWTPAVNTYIRGERGKQNDLMSWNADGTRMPWRMHSEYLERLYLKNELAAGTFSIDAQPVNLQSIQLPMFVVGTETDHVAPWQAVYKVRTLTRSVDYTFLLTSGGHNAGIVSGPSHPKRRYRTLTWSDAGQRPSADEWLAAAPMTAGSWWPVWQKWLAAHSQEKRVPARPVSGMPGQKGQQLEDAPGRYVRE